MCAALLKSVCLAGLLTSISVQAALSQGLPSPVKQSAASESKQYAAALLPSAPIADIRVEGNERIEAGTVKSYMVTQVGDLFDTERLDRSLKALYATGLFSDVTLRRDGNVLVVRVTENPIVNRVVFEGNHKLTDDNLRPVTQLKPRSVFTAAIAQLDRQKILDEYAKKGRFNARVEPKIIQLDQNRVDVVYEIDDGQASYISRIAFVGNTAFSEAKLKEVIASREEAFWRFLTNSDSYDPDRLNYDKELLRRFYMRNGYADFEVTTANAELAPDRSAFFVTFNINEGARYRVGSIKINSSLRNLDADSLLPLVEQSPGDWFDGDAVDRSVKALNNAVQSKGYAFVDVKPNIQRNKDKHTVDLLFDIGEGPRVYVERINITGNVRTEDKVIRREFRLAEGDSFNASQVRESRQRLDDLGFFNTVKVTSQPGSAPDKAIINAEVDEKATGELTVGGGYSTDAGALINLGLHEKNLIGSGVDAGINGLLGQKQSSVDFSVTNPYLFDRNLVGSINIFAVNNNNQLIAEYSERRIGFAATLGYEFNEHLRQSWTYTLAQRDVYNVLDGASLAVVDEAGTSLLSQIGQNITYDQRDSRSDPRKGYIIRVGTDFAGLGGQVDYIRTKIDGTYFISLERLLGDPEWDISLSAGTGYLFNLGSQERIIDRFFLGGDNLRGFQTGGAGPHATGNASDSLGGRFIWTQSSEVRFPLPVSPDLGLAGRAFVDVGALTGASTRTRTGGTITIIDSAAPRVGAGVGVSWRTPFGLINMDIAPFVLKQHYDQGQFFRFGFGTRF
jgi:outer membrane protein insertion porin family